MTRRAPTLIVYAGDFSRAARVAERFVTDYPDADQRIGQRGSVLYAARDGFVAAAYRTKAGAVTVVDLKDQAP